MAAKLLHSLADDNPDLQKQIGCMTGIFQVFDRHHVLTGKRISHKRLPPATSNFNNGSNNVHYHHPSSEISLNKSANEKQRLSTESSRASFSSACSSSASSVDLDRTAQQELPSSSSSLWDPVTNHQSSTSPRLGRLSLDLREVVKDAMYRETTRGLSVKTMAREESTATMRHRDSPRPFNEKRATSSVDLKESLRVLSKLRDAPWYESSLYEPKEGPRFSYDSRSTSKPRESSPRLSLDGRESSIRGSTFDSKPSVVAKLMGLDVLPDPNMATRTPNPPPSRISVKEPGSPRRRNSDFVMKPVSSSRFPIEPAPWNRVSARSAKVTRNSSPPSVYSEIEKRLKDLEFKQSGRDLRALKQILEAMQAKGLLETGREEPPSNRASGSSPRTRESPIVIMKPAKLAEKPSPRNSRVLPKDQSPKSNTRSVKTSGSVSPRLQEKKKVLEAEKRARPPAAPSSSSSKPRRQTNSNRPSTESGSPGGRSRARHRGANSQPYDDQSSEISNDSSVVSDGNAEVTSTLRSIELQKKVTPRLDDDVVFAELSAVAPDHPSPVSVLDASAYKDDEPSPVKQITSPIKDRWKPGDNLASKSAETKIAKKLENIENLVQKLRRLNSSHDEARTDYIASLCENSNPDHRYISEILLASGLLLRDLGSGLATFQLHPSGHPINPELFFVLEQTKASSSEKGICVKSKFHRKLVFDAVNEVLVGKFGSVNTVGPGKLAKKTLNAQRLLKELCGEIERLQCRRSSDTEAVEDSLKDVLWEDVMCRSGNWTEFSGEVSGVVLDVERSIFKDLVDEVVKSEVANLNLNSRGKFGRRRKLFAK